MPAPKPTSKPAKAGGTALAAAVAAILALIFADEGAFVNDPNDPGGATHWGCTEAVSRANGYRGPMKAMPRAECRRILKSQYIEKPGYLPIVEREPVLAYEVIDSGVNAGPGRSGLWFQESLNLFSRGGRDYPKIAEDGRVGPATILAFDTLRRKRGPVKACQLMVKAADAYQAGHYSRLCRGSYSLASFCVGWFDHRIGNAPTDKCGTGGI